MFFFVLEEYISERKLNKRNINYIHYLQYIQVILLDNKSI